MKKNKLIEIKDESDIPNFSKPLDGGRTHQIVIKSTITNSSKAISLWGKRGITTTDVYNIARYVLLDNHSKYFSDKISIDNWGHRYQKGSHCCIVLSLRDRNDFYSKSFRFSLFDYSCDEIIGVLKKVFWRRENER